MTQAATIYADVLRRHPGVDLWLGEGALHSNSGVPGMTNTFESSLWYAHALGSFVAIWGGDALPANVVRRILRDREPHNWAA